MDNSELLALQRVTKDIVAVSSLSNIWIGQQPSQVAASLVETLCKSLNLEFAYLVFAHDELQIESAYGLNGFLPQDDLLRLARHLDPLLKNVARPHPFDIANPFGEGMVKIALTTVGATAQNSFLVAASKRENFPQEAENVLISIVANQAFVTIQYKWQIEISEKLRLASRRSEERLNLALVAAKVGFWDWNAITGRLDLSDTLMAEWGINPKTFGHTLPECMDIIHSEDRDRVWVEIQRSIFQKKPYDVEYRIVLADGEIIWINAKGRFFLDAQGKPERLTGIATNITDRVLASTAIKQAKNDAERANELKSAFLANMSHEVRTPLGVLLGFTDLIGDPNLAPEDRAQYAAVLKRNGEQLSVIVNDILDLSKVESGFLQIENLEFSLREMIEELMTTINPRAGEKDLVLTVDFDETMPAKIGSDPVRLKQILTNMLTNAIKFTERGSVTLSISAPAGPIVFRITDTGIGISATESAKLFQPFSQADVSTTRKFGGTGLGLALSKRLAILLGGDLALEMSEPEIGSTFCLSIENRVAKAAEPSTRVTEKRKHPSRGLKNVRVLLVEDSLDNQELIKNFLSHEGAIVEVANHGLEGVEKALRGKYDLVVMDVQMPVMDGYTATQRLREQGYRQPIVALTAHAMSEVRKRCLDVGFTDYLAKPVNFKELINKLEDYISRS